MKHFNNNYWKYALILTAMVFLFMIVDKTNRYHQVYESLDIEFSAKTVEYGSAVHAKDLVKSHIGQLSTDKDIDTYSLGEQVITYSLSKSEERYRQNVQKDFEIPIEVKDTKAPILELNEEEVYAYAGNEYDLNNNIKDAYDIIDGKIEDIKFIGEYDLNKAGTYELQAVAKDKNGLATQKSFTLTVRKRVISGSEGYNIIFSSLIDDYGYNKAAACGILANIRHESNFNPDIGDYYYGLCQWGGSRKENLFAYCSQNGLDAASIQGQLAYLNYEMDNSYPGVKNYLQSIENSSAGAYDAAEYFCHYFEGAASSEGRGDLAVSYFNS